VLFIILIVFSLLLKVHLRPPTIFLLSVLIYPGLLPIPAGIGVLSEVRGMAIYVALGLIIGSDQNLRTITNVKVHWLSIAVLLGVIISSFGGWVELSSLPLLRFTLAIGGIVAVLALALIVDKATFGIIIRFLGSHSLEIYVMHTMASAGVRLALIQFFHINSPALHFVLGTFSGLCFPILIAMLLERIGFRFAFKLPATLTPPGISVGTTH
jgi:hypothetical protein